MAVTARRKDVIGGEEETASLGEPTHLNNARATRASAASTGSGCHLAYRCASWDRTIAHSQTTDEEAGSQAEAEEDPYPETPVVQTRQAAPSKTTRPQPARSAAGPAISSADLTSPLNERTTNNREPRRRRVMKNSKLKFDRADNITPVRVDWIWENYVPRGRLMEIAGDPGLGKSTLICDLAARLSSERKLPDGSRVSGRCRVGIITGEESKQDVQARLQAASADLKSVFVMDMANTFVIPDQCDALEEAIGAKDLDILFIDPFMATLARQVDSHKDQSIRQALQPLARIASSTRTTICIVRHLNKSNASQATYRSMGSIGITAALRHGLLVALNPAQPDERVLSVYKTNLCRPPTGLGFSLLPDSSTGTAKVKWLGEAPFNANELVMNVGDAPKSAEAKRMLLQLLSDKDVRRSEIETEAGRRNISWRLVEAAKAELDITHYSRRQPGKRGAGPYWWSLKDTKKTAKGKRVLIRSAGRRSGSAADPTRKRVIRKRANRDK